MQSTFINKKSIGLSLLIILGIGIVFRNYLFGSLLYIFDDIGNDTLTLFYPHLLAELYNRSEPGFSTWSFSQGIGQNIFNQSILDVLDIPFHFLSAKGMAQYIIWRQIIRIVLAGFFIYQYFKLLKLSPYTRSLGVLLFTFSGYMIVSSSWYGHTEFVLYFAAAMYTMELLIQKNKWWPLSIVLFYMFGEKILFFLEFAILYYLIRIAEIEQFELKKFRKDAINGIKAGILTLVLMGPFLGSYIYHLLYSPRVSGGAGNAEALSSNPMFAFVGMDQLWTAILRFFSPDMIGNGSQYQGWYNYLEGPNFYIGLLTLLTFTQAFTLFKRKQKLAYLAIIAFWTLLIIFPYFRYAFYAFAGNYYKGALSVYIPFTFLYISLKSIDKIRQDKGGKLSVLLITSLCLLLVLFIPNNLSSAIDNTLRSTTIAFLLLYTMALMYIFKKENNNYAYYSIIGLVFIEAMLMGSASTNPRIAVPKKDLNKRILYNDFTKEAIGYLNSISKPFYRIEKTYGSYKAGYNDAMAQNYFSTKNYDSHNHNNYISFLRNYELIRGNTEVETRWLMGLVSDYYVHPIFSNKYILSTDATEEYVWKTMYRKINSLNGINIFESNSYIPFGIPIEKYFSQATFAKIQGKYQKNMSMYEGVVIENEDKTVVSNLSEAGLTDVPSTNELSYYASVLAKKSMKLKSFSQKNITGSIDLEKPSVVLFSMPFDAGWNAKVDGINTKLIKVDFGLTGLPINMGKHEIELYYIPPFFILGWISLSIGIIVLLLVILSEKGLLHKWRKNGKVIA